MYMNFLAMKQVMKRVSSRKLLNKYRMTNSVGEIYNQAIFAISENMIISWVKQFPRNFSSSTFSI